MVLVGTFILSLFAIKTNKHSFFSPFFLCHFFFQCAESYSSSHYASGPCKGMQFTQADSLWAAKAKNVGKYVAIGAGAVVVCQIKALLSFSFSFFSFTSFSLKKAAPLVLAGGVIVIAGGIIALPIWGITKGIKSLAN